MYLPLYLSIYLSAEAILRDFLEIWKLTAEKRSCLRDFLRIWKLTTSKTQQFCETSSICEIGNVKNEAILRDFPQKWKVEYGLVPMRFVTAPLHLSKSTAPAAKKWGQVIQSAASVMQNHVRKPDDLILQNATSLRKSAPWPPNIFDEDVPDLVCFVHFDFEMRFAPHQCVLFNISTSKSGPRPRCVEHFDFKICFAPQRRAIFDFSSDQMAPHPPL